MGFKSNHCVLIVLCALFWSHTLKVTKTTALRRPPHTTSLSWFLWAHACWLWRWIPRWYSCLKMCLRCDRDHRGWCIGRQWWHQNIWLIPQCLEMLVWSRCAPSIMTQRQVSSCIPPPSWQGGLMLLFYDSLPVCLGNNESCAQTTIPLFTWYSQDLVLRCFLKKNVWAAYWQSEIWWYGQT